MNNMDVNQVLAQMRSMQIAASGLNASGGVSEKVAELDKANAGDKVSFSDVMKETVGQVNQSQAVASQMTSAYAAGSQEVDLPEVMVAVQEASISFQAISQVRNRLLSAYQDVMNMPL